MDLLLEVDEIHTFYGSIEALKGVSLTVADGEVVTLIGSNGAGKSTTLRSIAGLTSARRGTVRFAGEAITAAPAHEIVGLGIAMAPEGRHCFPRMTVRENLDLGAYRRRGPEIAEDLERVYELFPRLRERERQMAGTMSGGEQQMLAIGRALMARPRLLLLDEPSMGIAPVLVQRIYETIAEINRGGVAILLVEQNANYALEVATRGYVLETGQVALADSSASLRDNPDVRRAYLGA
jgi:branched-chain amino acid transport system ATP-binding protein